MEEPHSWTQYFCHEVTAGFLPSFRIVFLRRQPCMEHAEPSSSTNSSEQVETADLKKTICRSDHNYRHFGSAKMLTYPLLARRVRSSSIFFELVLSRLNFSLSPDGLGLFSLNVNCSSRTESSRRCLGVDVSRSWSHGVTCTHLLKMLRNK